MFTLAHTGGGHGWGGPIEPWEIHPILVHFPIAFLIGGVLLDLYAWGRGRAGLAPFVAGLLAAGLLTGLLTALAGLLAFFLVPAHTEEAHRLMYWHLGLQAAALALFAWPAWVGWRGRSMLLPVSARAIGWVAALLLTVGAGVGGYIVYHGGAGVEEKLLAPWVSESHGHREGHEEQPGTKGDTHREKSHEESHR